MRYWKGLAALVLVAAVVATVIVVGGREDAAAEQATANPSAGDGNWQLGDKALAAALDDTGYQELFARRYKRIVGSRRHPLYASPRCESSESGWRYRPRDAYLPFSDDVDWQGPPGRDSNWAWRHHNLYLIDCHMVRYLADRDPERIEDARLVIRDWIKDNAGSGKSASRFAWGDHTTALRLRGVIELYALLKNLDVLEPDFALEIARFVELHTDRLLRDPAIVREKHNHALDQVNALALSHQFFPFLRYRGFDLGKEVARRFEVERDHLIASDGVATENSPAYHMWVPTRIAIMEDSLELIGNDTRRQALQSRNGSLEFATWILAPDGYLPQIGDTAPKKRANIRLPGQPALPSFGEYKYAVTDGQDGTKPSGQFKLFPAAGYFIHRNDWAPPLEDDTHFVLKCGFLADAHRHADDGSFTLRSGGEAWFIDTGMYGYQAGAKRAHALGASAHNISYVAGDTVKSIASRRYERHRSRWGLSDFVQAGPAKAGVTCTSFMFPEALYRREVSIDGSRIELVDTFGFERDGLVPATRFQVPYDKSIELQGQGAARICGRDGNCIGLAFPAGDVEGVSIIDGKEVDADAFRTRAYLKTEPSRVIEIRWRTGVESMRFAITL